MANSNERSLPFVPLAKNAPITVEYVDYFVRSVFAEFLKATPEPEITHGILIGLITKAKKLYDACSIMVGHNDILALSILLRSYYETTISIRYILRYLDDDKTIEKFIIGDAMGRLKANDDALKNEKINKEQHEFTKNSIEKSLEHESLLLKDIPRGYPKSWHPTKSYKDIARSLDETGEALGIYEALYSATSQLAHPSLADIMRWHVTKHDDKSPYIPNENKMYWHNDSTILLGCISLAMLQDFALASDEFNNFAVPISTLHLEMHKTFNDQRPEIVTYIESLKKYADFWSLNYPEEKLSSSF